MIRKFVDFINKILCWVKRNQITKPKTKLTKINVGSGAQVSAGWINIDVGISYFFSKSPTFILKKLYNFSGYKHLLSREQYCDILRNHTLIHHDVGFGIPFSDDSVDYLYASHFLEHLFIKDAKKFLRESYRVLKKGGILRVCVPDLERIIQLYHGGKKKEALDWLYGVEDSGYFCSHKYAYDYELLKRYLEESGFINIKRCSFMQGETPDINVLDNRREDTLYVEAAK